MLVNDNGTEKKSCHNNSENENAVINHFTRNSNTISTTQRKQKCRTKLDAFLFQNRNKLVTCNSQHKEMENENKLVEQNCRHEQSMETEDLLIPIKKPKKAPSNSAKSTKLSTKLKSNSSKSQSKQTKKSDQSKKSQISIKSAFWLSNISAQQGSPDKIENQQLQLALNMSSIEYENSKIYSSRDVQCCSKKDFNPEELKRDTVSIQDKLKMYGFRKATQKGNIRSKVAHIL